MPQKLTTTVNKITTLSNSVNASIIDEFYQYMRSTGTSEHHQNNSLKVVIAFAKFLVLIPHFMIYRGKNRPCGF
jgi:hypothetical protein